MDYLAHLRADAARLLDAADAAGLSAPVPTCPGWDVAALLGHVGAVYEHKVEAMRLGGRPIGEREERLPDGADPVKWFTTNLDDVLAELTSRGPDAPSWTWDPRDQTVGFWFRRMAQETAVHRVDAEAAAKRESTIDDALAQDGVDERLRVMLAHPYWDEHPWDKATGRTFAVRAGDRVWRVTSTVNAAPRVEDGPGEAAGEVSGTPYDVLMWVWGRPSNATTTGDVAELSERLALDA
jgi:uncharacterized protein (TIGR03083 family)